MEVKSGFNGLQEMVHNRQKSAPRRQFGEQPGQSASKRDVNGAGSSDHLEREFGGSASNYKIYNPGFQIVPGFPLL